MGMSKRVKALIERGYGNDIWIGKATPRDDVAALLARLRPHDSSRGLVRIGPAGDGGYLLPGDLDGVIACVSPGVSTESRFDLAIAERGIPVHMADASVDGPSLSHPLFHFSKAFLGPVTGGNTITITDYCAAIPGFAAGGDAILQMDIEGAEYAVLQSMEKALLDRFRIVILELHGVENLFHAFSFGLMRAAFDKLLASHAVVHIHPNNCCGIAHAQGLSIPRVLEMTLLRRDRATFSHNPARAYPHALDADCKPANPTVVLPACWR
jgi:Methyltransferase FkbM domain